jgi:protein-arginine kinase
VAVSIRLFYSVRFSHSSHISFAIASKEDRELLEEVCSYYDLQPRGSAGEHSAAVGGKFDISNKQRLGLSEVQLVQKMIDGVSKVIYFEEQLASGAMTPSQVRDMIHRKSQLFVHQSFYAIRLKL